MLIKHLQVCSVHQISVLKQVWLKTTNSLNKSSIINLEMAQIKGPSVFSVCSLLRHGLSNTVLGKSSFVSEVFSTCAYPGDRAVPFPLELPAARSLRSGLMEEAPQRVGPERLLSEASPHEHAANKHTQLRYFSEWLDDNLQHIAPREAALHTHGSKRSWPLKQR